MTALQQLLHRNGRLTADALQTALRRQQIYGGSLDTVLLEKDLISPIELIELIEQATNLPRAPLRLLRPRPGRPFDAVPADLSDVGWAFALAQDDGTVYVAVHPDLPDDKLGHLYRTVPGVSPMVAPECVLARLAAERSGSVIPQRYAGLSARVLEVLVAADEGTPPPAASASSSVRRQTLALDPDDVRPAQPLTPGPIVSEPPIVAAVKVFQGAPPVGRTPRPTPAPAQAVVPQPQPQAEPAAPPPPEPEPAPPPEPQVGLRADKLAALVRSGLANIGGATERDEITSALASSLSDFSSRAALFAVKSGRLRALPMRGGLSHLENMEIPLADAGVFGGILAGGPAPDVLDDPRLLPAFSLHDAVPCLIASPRVRDRPVLLAYVDRRGEPFAPGERAALTELCDATGHAFEQMLVRMRSQPPGAVQRDDSMAIPLTIPVQPTPPPVRVEPVPSVPNVPNLLAPAPETPRHNTLIGTAAPEFRRPEPAGPAPAAWDQEAPAVSPRITYTGAPTPPPPLPPPPDSPALSRDDADPTLTGIPAPEHPKFSPPPLVGQSELSGIISLSAPLTTSSRGRIELDDEDRVAAAPKNSAADTAVSQAIDRVIAREGGSVAEITALGTPGLLGLAGRFPGPLEVLRRDLQSLPPPSAHGPLIRASIRLGRPFAPYLIELLDHPNPDIRFYAAFVFQELRDDRCVKALASMAFDASGDVRVIAMRVLETYSRTDSFDHAAAKVREGLSIANRTKQLHAARAVGTLRDRHAVPGLIELLSSKDRFIQEASLEALCSITGQQHGLKPHRWRNWWKDQGSDHRVEWIIGSLKHKDLPVRRWAFDELVRVTGHRVLENPGGDKREQAACAQAWQDWWETDGSAAFR